MASVAEQVCGSTTITYQGHEIDFSKPWNRVELKEGLIELAGIDIEGLSRRRKPGKGDERKRTGNKTRGHHTAS